VSDSAAHPALLSSNFATSFTSAATGHAFFSGDRERHNARWAEQVMVFGESKRRFYTEFGRPLKAYVSKILSRKRVTARTPQ
jgi:hypothetical protein